MNSMNQLRGFQEAVIKSDLKLRLFPCRKRTKQRVISAAVLTDPTLWTARSERDARRVLKRQVAERCRDNNVGNPLILIAIISLIIQVLWIWWQWRNSKGEKTIASNEWTDMMEPAIADLVAQ